MHVRVPEAGDESLALAIDDPRPGRYVHAGRWPHCRDQTLIDDHRLRVSKPGSVHESADVGKSHGTTRRLEKGFRCRRGAFGECIVLCFLKLPKTTFIPHGNPGKRGYESEKLAGLIH